MKLLYNGSNIEVKIGDKVAVTGPNYGAVVAEIREDTRDIMLSFGDGTPPVAFHPFAIYASWADEE